MWTANQERESVPDDSLSIGEASILFSSVAKTCGTFDADLSFDQHGSSVFRSCFLYPNLKQSPFIPRSQSRKHIAVSLILSKLDYYNSFFAGLPKLHIKRLQVAQNAAARTVMKSMKTDHITPIFRELHQLYVQELIHHKLLSVSLWKRSCLPI